ncbi:hypothetical protein F8M41_011210 [Gigaspora margarita]|uniref:Uncharacterized protein n=1 Tax=Gigaspora margarita TaxID=4874 RepID=A0A8H4B452_GIGMA|nr:hypothetical protein F8M41_011210 [Gigaspora margarita]
MATMDPTLVCYICDKEIKSKRGLSYHNTMVKKFNTHQSNINKLPKGIITEFKNIIVSLIHHNLPLNFKSMGKQTLSIPCPESLFYAIFLGHIHYYSSVQELINVNFIKHQHIKL